MSAPKAPTVAGDDVGAVVVDCGSWLVRVGAAGDDAPKALVPPAVAVPASGERYAGDRVLLSPLAAPDIGEVYSHDASGSAAVNDWDAMQTVWQAGAKQAGVDLSSSPLMIVEPTRAWDDSHRSKALERAFEGCGVGSAYIGRGAAMAAFASARTTACVVDVGHQGASAVPVLEGYTLRKTTISSEVGGHFLSERLHAHAQDQMAKAEDSEAGDSRTPVGSALSRMRALHEVRRRRKPDAPPASDDAPDGEPVRRFSVEDLTKLDPQKSFTDNHRAFYRLRLLDDFKVSTFRVSPGASSTSSPTGAASNGDVVMADARNDAGGGGGGQSGQGTNGGGATASTTNADNAADATGASAANKSEKEGKELDREKEREREIEKSREKERFPSLSTTYELPDGNIIDVSKSSSKDAYIADILFDEDPSVSSSHRAISKMAYDAISACDIDMRRELYGGIVLTGGCSLIPGTVERFTRELAILTPQLFKMKIIASQTSIERTAGPWIGGSIVSSLGTFQQAWISKSEYDELGSTGALRKCP